MADEFEKWWNYAFTDEDEILVHIDKHRKMFEGTDLDDVTQPFPCCETITWLVLLPRTLVVLTYSCIRFTTSAVCRKVIAIPPVDINEIINSHPGLSLLQWGDGSECKSGISVYVSTTNRCASHVIAS